MVYDINYAQLHKNWAHGLMVTMINSPQVPILVQRLIFVKFTCISTYYRLGGLVFLTIVFCFTKLL